MAKRLSGIFILIILACAPAREAHPQFTAPFDPDFQQPAAAPSKGTPAASAEEAPAEGIQKPAPSEGPGVQAPVGQAPVSPETREWVRRMMETGGPFTLTDRTDPKHFFEQEESTQTVDFAEFERNLKSFRYNQTAWNKARADLENGTLPLEELEVPVLPLPPSEILVSTESPRAPPPEVEMPSYGTSLSITGRKVVGFNFSEKRFLHDQATTGRPQTTNLIDIQQQLQLRMQGKIGPKITVNVDFDDTKTNKQDISVVYNGDPNEVVQNASFGDIDLSLPATEFVSYNKQLFGIRADIKYKGFKATFIGSRTKGTTKSKQFIGNTQFASLDILDTSYIRRSRYDLSFGNTARLPIQVGTERIFLAQQNPQAVNANSVQLTVDDLAVPSSSFTGIFNQLAPGTDYTMDYINGIITFRNIIQPQFVIAVDFVDATGNHIVNQTTQTFTGGTGLLKLIKTNADIPISVSSGTGEVGFNRELKTVYSIGQNQIIRDDGRGNFILTVLDPHSRNEVGSGLTPVQKYPDTIFVDFENGFFRLQQPFGIGVSSPSPDPDIYSPTPITKRIFHVEYHYRLRTFLLEPNLVLQSEIVLVDGVRLNRNVDYFIDYDSGFITFFNEQRIGAQSVVDISYEVAPFSGVTSESILGGRTSYDFNKHAGVGTTILYDAGTKSPTVPSVTDLARSLLIWEADSQVKEIYLLPKLKMLLLGAEYARSTMNPNLNDKALIDNMEGARQEDSASTFAQQWVIASNPTQGPADPQAISWFNEDVLTHIINPNAPGGPNDSQKVLDINYNFGVNGTTETSIVYVFSPTGLDFSQKNTLELTMLGDASNNEFNIRLGGINEDADGTGGMTQNCGGIVKKNVPKTEDLNCDGILQPGEDVGWTYAPIGKNSQSYGAGNGRLDSEDLNQNGILDPDDGTGDNYGYNATTGTRHNQLFDATTSSSRTFVDFGGTTWHTFQIPLDISTDTVQNWNAVKEVRISIRQRPGGASKGTLKFARLAVVGNSWQKGQSGDPKDGSGPVGIEELQVSAVNNVANPNYLPIFNAAGDAQSVFNDLYGGVGNLQQQSNSKNITEQSLQLQWTDLNAGATVFTRRIFPRPLDISQHHYFNFLVYGNADASNTNLTGDKIFFLRAGSDQSYFEAQVPINFTGWRKIIITQVDATGNKVASYWQSSTPGVTVISTGVANLTQVSEIVAGVYSTTPTVAGSDPNRGALWLDEIYVSGAMTRVGIAQKVEAQFEVPGWATFGGKYRSVDRNYQTPTTVVTNQDNRQDTAYLNLTRMSFLPLTFSLKRTITDTPNTNLTGSLSNLIDQLQQGKVTKWDGNANANFAYGAYPRLSMGYIRARTEYDLLTRLDDRNTYNSALSYAIPLNHFFIPRTVDLGYSYTKNSTSYGRPDVLLVTGNFNTNEYTNTYGPNRLSFIPWAGSSFNPNFNLTQVTEKRSDFSSGQEQRSQYPKAINETMGFSSNWRLLKWLNPAVNYTVNNIENNVLVVSTFVVNNSTAVYNPGDIKTVNRSANGSVSIPINIVEIFPKTKLFHSLNIANGYQLQDGDVWNNVEKELDTRGIFFVRQPLRPTAIAATRANLTLRDTFNTTQRWSPLEAYGILGRLASLKTLSLSNNLVRSIQRTETTGTPSKTISTTLPDAVASLSKLENLLYSERWMTNGQINLKYAAHKTETLGTSLSNDDALGTDMRAMIRKKFDSAISVNIRNSDTKDLIQDVVTQKTHHEDATVQTTFDIQAYRFTPKVDYSKDTSEQGTGIQTQNLTVITPSLLVRADLAIPRGLLLPFTNKTLIFTNRIIWTNNLSFAIRHSPVTQADNSKLMTYNTSGDYELAKNLRMTLNGAFSRLWHDFLKEEDFISYQFGTTITLQF